MAGIGNPGASVFHPPALNSKRSHLPACLPLVSSRPPRAVTAAAAALTARLVLCWVVVCGAAASCGTGLCPVRSGPLPFLSAYKRAASRLWGRRGRRFLVALSPSSPLPSLPSLPFHWSAQSRRHHHLKKAKRAHGGGEEKRPPPHTPFTPGSIDQQSRRALYPLHACCVVVVCCCCAAAPAQVRFLIYYWNSVARSGKDPDLAGGRPGCARALVFSFFVRLRDLAWKQGELGGRSGRRGIRCGKRAPLGR